MSFLSSCTSGGCGAKIAPGDLSGTLQSLPRATDPNLLVGFDSFDDSAVYKLSDEEALVSSVDFFSPMVEDPKTFGRIAAANALSDIYAMGGRVLYALNLVCFPQKMDKAYLHEMLAGGAEKILEAGAVLAGGHSIYDHEPKYGLAVTGLVRPTHILCNNTPQVGDVLILTKPLGVGLVLSAARGGLAEQSHVRQAIASMERLNKYAAQQLEGVPVHACTDITGFGLLGHALEMAGDQVTLLLDTEQLPVLPGALSYAEQDLGTAGGQRNRVFQQDKCTYEGLSTAMQEVLFDPQTSGGLLISVAVSAAAALLSDIQREDPAAAIIGEVLPRQQEPVMIL